MVSLLTGNPADLGSLLSRLCADLEAFIAAQQQGNYPGSPGGPPLWVYSTERKSTDFNVTAAQLTVANQAQRVLGANPRRTAFVLQPATAGSLYVGSQDFDPNQSFAIQTAEFGLTGHTGEVWVASSVVPLTISVIEQWTADV